TLCGETCVDTKIDPKNCGACGTVCADGDICSDSKCGLFCAGGTTRCGDGSDAGPDGGGVDICVDTQKDPSHCGDCDTVCKTGEVCSFGTCGIDCVGGSTLCNGMCVATQNDPNNCGNCGTTCTGGKVCSMGNCGLSCVGGTTLCNGVCIDT